MAGAHERPSPNRPHARFPMSTPTASRARRAAKASRGRRSCVRESRSPNLPSAGESRCGAHPQWGFRTGLPVPDRSRGYPPGRARKWPRPSCRLYLLPAAHGAKLVLLISHLGTTWTPVAWLLSFHSSWCRKPVPKHWLMGDSHAGLQSSRCSGARTEAAVRYVPSMPASRLTLGALRHRSPDRRGSQGPGSVIAIGRDPMSSTPRSPQLLPWSRRPMR